MRYVLLFIVMTVWNLCLFWSLNRPHEEKLLYSKFEVGDCIQMTSESWEWTEDFPTLKIMQVGQNKYKTCTIGQHCTDVLNSMVKPTTLLFLFQDEYFTLSCKGQ